MTFVLSKRGRRKFVDEENYIYVFSKYTNDNEHSVWVCEKRNECNGRLWTIGNTVNVAKVITNHTHAAQAGKPEAIRVLSEIKERAENNQENPVQIMATVLENVHSNVSTLLPSKDSLRKVIQRKRRVEGMPPVPRDLEHLIIPQAYRHIETDGQIEQFLLYDSENELLPQRILIFSTQENLRLLSASENWYVDGTFSTSPNLFEQLYTVHVRQFDTVLPVVYALISNKTKASYKKLLQEIKNLQPGLQPRTVLMDFEQAAISAFQEEFPGIEVEGCFFHLCQSVYRRVQREGLQVQYNESHEFAVWIRKICALAFVPVQSVVDQFDSLVEDENFPQDALPIADYFEDCYIGRRNRRQRRAPQFSIEMWNVYNRTLNDRHRTNNNVEGWHRAFQSTCGNLFPNIFHFINSLRKQQALHRYDISQLLLGVRPKKNKKYVVISSRIKNIVQSYGRIDNMDYLLGIAHNFEF